MRRIKKATERNSTTNSILVNDTGVNRKETGDNAQKRLKVVWAELLLLRYLEESRSTIKKDHGELEWLLTMSEASGKLVHYRLRLLQFDFDAVHRAGVKRLAGDALLCLETGGVDTKQ